MYTDNCPVEATLDLIGGKYKALILWHLAEQTMRFSQLHKAIPHATAKMLTQQLLKRGLVNGSKQFTEAMRKAWEDNNVKALPEK